MSAASTTPNHVAFILDGNRRWAKAKGLPTLEGHRKGYEQLKDIARECFDRGIKYVTAFIFSTENWNREETEVNYLMDLALRMFKRDMKEINKDNIRVRVFGFRDKIKPSIVKAISEAEELTKNNTGGQLNICFNYGGQQEITRAVTEIVKEGIDAEQITPEVVKAHLFTAEIPAPDVIVRTSGEQRLSNFLLWDSAYAELMFVPEPWPDFSKQSLDKVLAEYANRQRRFGK